MKDWSLKKKVVVGLLALVVLVLIVPLPTKGEVCLKCVGCGCRSELRLNKPVVWQFYKSLMGKNLSDSNQDKAINLKDNKNLIYEKKEVVVPTTTDMINRENVDSGKQEDVVPEDVPVGIEPNL